MKPFEDRLESLNKKSIDKLLRILLQFQCKDYVSEKEIYNNFKKIYHNIDEIKIINNLNYALDLYEEIYNGDIDKIESLDYLTFIKLQPNNNELYSIVIMILLDKLKSEIINVNIYNESTKILSEYIFRRRLADLDTSSITRLFNETLIRKIRSESKDLANVLRIELFENTKSSHMNTPTNNEIKTKLLTTNFYNLAICKTFFFYLENWKNSIHLRYKTLTIEHLAPQSPKKGEWIKILKTKNLEEYEEKINLMGNLTILPKTANQILINRSWNEKKEKLSDFGHIKINQDLQKIDNLDKIEIEERQNQLIDKFFKTFN